MTRGGKYNKNRDEEVKPLLAGNDNHLSRESTSVGSSG